MEMIKKFQLDNSPWPKENALHVVYDYKYLLDFFKVDDVATGQMFFTRTFVKTVCQNLNTERAQKVMKALGLIPRFDSIQVKDKNVLVCRFTLPYERGLKQASFAFFFDLIYNDETKCWVEKIICDENYFIMVSRIIS